MSLGIGMSKLTTKLSALLNEVYWVYFGYAMIAAVIVKYTFLYWITFTLGIGCVFAVLSYWVVSFKGPLKSRKAASKRKFKFLDDDAWERFASEHMTNHDEMNSPIVESSFLISETLDEFISLILKEFIDGWFTKISESDSFRSSIKLELKSVFKKLKARIEQMDIPQLLVSRIVPVVNEHIQQFIKAEELARLKPSHSNTLYESSQYNMAIVRHYYKGKLHPAVTVNLNLAEDVNEKKYLRKKILSILPLLLSDSEAGSEIGTNLVTEILACTILANLLKMLAESDFYNLLVVKLIGDNLKHRSQVKQLRAALEQHTQSVNRKGESPIKSMPTVLSNIKSNILTSENTNSESFQMVLEAVERLDSREDLMSLNEFLKSQLQNANRSSLEENVAKIQFAIDKLEGKMETNDNINEEQPFQITLNNVLHNTFALQEFLRFMKERNKQNKFILWNAIESIKAPLEDVAINNEDDDENDKLHLSLEFSSVEDIRAISKLIEEETEISLDSDSEAILRSFFESKDLERLDMISEVRQLLFKYQSNIYSKMNEDFKSFVSSNSFKHLVSIGAFQVNEKEVRSVPGKVQHFTKKDHVADTSDSVSSGVVKAVEDAFSEIMKNSVENVDVHSANRATLSSFSSFSSASDLSDSTLQNSSSKKDLFGDNTNLFGEDSFSSNSHYNNHKASRLFDDASEDSETDSDSVIMDSDSQYQLSMEENRYEDSDSQIFLAAPGNLSLSEEISKLDDEIEKLNEQLAILEPLIKKAELTDNVNELKILKKSKTSMNREISSKELQKQQYIVQENDNSLYGKSKVRIQSYISGTENNKEFIVYIVEVQKISDDDVVTAGWIVARRFSQFFKLNEYLKARYPQVSNIKFPKRTVSVLKFQQKQLVEIRKRALEEYLQQVIKMPEVCSSQAFRSFLSSENFNISKNEPFDENVKTRANSYKNNVEFVATKLYKGISNRLNQSNSHPRYDVTPNADVVDNLKDMQKELRQFDEFNSPSSKPIFVKPICDILITIFRLNSSKSWLRGRALLVILQQIFGTTIEKKVYEFVDTNVRTEEKALDILIQVKNVIFPNGKFKDPPVERSIFEQTSTRHEAKVLLNAFMNETCSKIFGLSNTNFAFSKIFGVLQNEVLNKHLIFELLDQILLEMFPEMEVLDSSNDSK